MPFFVFSSARDTVGKSLPLARDNSRGHEGPQTDRQAGRMNEIPTLTYLLKPDSNPTFSKHRGRETCAFPRTHVQTETVPLIWRRIDRQTYSQIDREEKIT